VTKAPRADEARTRVVIAVALSKIMCEVSSPKREAPPRSRTIGNIELLRSERAVDWKEREAMTSPHQQTSEAVGQ